MKSRDGKSQRGEENREQKTHDSQTTFGSWDVEKCTQLWREAHVQVKMRKTHQVWSTFGSWVHAVVARSTFPSQNVKSTTLSDHFWTFRVAGAKDCAPCQKRAKREDFCGISQNDGRSGTFEGAFSMAGAVQETCSSEMLGGQGADFLRGVAFWSITSTGLLRWFCATVQHFVWLGVTFSWQAQYFRQMKRENRKTHWYEAVSSALHFPFLKEVSQNCFVFDVVNFESWGSLAE